VIAVVIGSGLVLAVRSVSGRHPSTTPGRAAAPAVAAAVESSLADLRSDPNARRAVIAAYGRMEAALAAAGLPRRAAEAPREYLTRALGALELSVDAPRALTGLFERAKFGSRQVEVSMRDQAIESLLAIQRELEAML
jgi:Domain of unknown function (DUF4129)